MKIFLFSILLAFIGCNPSKNTVELNAAQEKSKTVVESLPLCVKQLIEKMKSEAVTNPPGKVYSYIYKGKKVFYVPAVCCDNFSDLYNDSCKILGHPNGGFTGKGDGNFKDFELAKSDEKLLWGR